MKTFLIADNQDITREGLTSLLEELQISDTFRVKNCTELRIKLSQYPDCVVIIDYTLFDFASAEQFLNMKAGAKQSSWILFSDEPEESFLRYILLSDKTVSIVTKSDSKDDILDAIHSASNNRVYHCESAKSILGNAKYRVTVSAPERLTATEKIILREIALGKMTKEIAYEKSLSFHTVNTHRRNIFRKLEINNVHEATKYAFRSGLIDPVEYYL
ncbi:MAG: response regulator transcription factor [Tannerella sp.]|jgi:DNA-binding NarL/FixJ family response regulator|nr:response regulator transcription factor [Tannerella sp.]